LGALGLRPPIVVNGDQWDGYQAEQRLLTRAFGEAGNVVLLTGDIHSSCAAEVPEDPGSYLTVVGGTSRAVEFVTPAVTSGSFSHMLSGILPGLDGLTHLGPVLLAAVGSWFTYFDGERHGFGV